MGLSRLNRALHRRDDASGNPDVTRKQKGQRMPLYEHTFLARQDVTQAQVEALMKEFEGVITAGQGKVTKQEYWGLKGLAFKVKKNRKAHYAFFNIDSPPAAVAEMERLMGINPDVIRFLTVRVEELETEPSVQMRKSDRDDRGERGDRGGFGGGGGGRGGFGGPRGDRGGFGGGGGREGGSTFRSRPPREGGDSRPPREGGAGFGDRGPRPPRPPRDAGPGSTSGSEG
jgi:small subunit ribosomal protein S6